MKRLKKQKIEVQRSLIRQMQKLNKNWEKQGSFKKGNQVDHIIKLKKVAQNLCGGEIVDLKDGDLSGTGPIGVTQVIMAKVAWMKVTQVIQEDDGTERTTTETPEPSLVPLTQLKQNCPLKLLDFYEKYYF